ncbi:hypothetical protein [Kallotenue papyrolyticum]|uniref:hypothetical protein n=1 Tax=Kallotenue papyrolyticum TaxID=1325125 RepID=UPI0004928777|nr:hypothetical protein [Kallotenue papyrolyticum]
MTQRRLIRASEIGEYVYCRRAWWLRVVCGQQPADQARRAQGQALHLRHGRQVWLAQILAALGLVLALLGIGVLVLG